jgi:hypothetical protein
MKTQLRIVGFVIGIALLSVSAANASDMYGYFLEKQSKALPAIIHQCLVKGDDAACGNAMRDLVQAEMGMVSYGKNYLDEDLYSRLSSDLGDHQHRRFAWRVLQERLKNLNCAIEPADSVFP